MIVKWDLLRPYLEGDLLPFLVVAALTFVSWVSWNQFRSSRSRYNKILGEDVSLTSSDDPERWLCRTLFRLPGNIQTGELPVEAYQLISTVNPIGKDWIFGKICKSGECGWLPQSALEIVDTKTSADLDRQRLKVLFSDNHLPTMRAPTPISHGIIWCIVVFNPDHKIRMRPSLGSAKDFIAIAELYPGRKTIAIGGPIPVVIKQESSQRPDADDLASFLSYVNAQLHPQRLIVVIDGDPSPYAAISGSWNGEDRANWVSLETASNHLQRANLRTPIAVLALIQPSKATLATVHTLFQCCSLLVTAHKVTQESCLAVLNQLVLVLLARPDADVLSISSCFRTCGTVSVYRCSQYPTVAILLRSFCSIVLSCLSFTDKTQCRRISQLLRPYCHNSEASGALVDALVDVVGFCASSASALSEVSVLQVLNEKIQTAVADLIISNHRDRWSGTFFSGLSMHYPIQALCRASEIMSRADTYIDELPRYYSYYDILPGLHQRIIDREKILKQSEQKPKQTQESIQIMALKAWEQRRNIAIATSLV